MPTQRKQPESNALTIWGDLKTFLTAGLLLCCPPLGLIMMWSWGIWSSRIRKIVTWLAVLVVAAVIAMMMLCGSSFRGYCGAKFLKSCGIHQNYGCQKSHGGQGCAHGKSHSQKFGEHKDWQKWDQNDDEEEDE